MMPSQCTEDPSIPSPINQSLACEDSNINRVFCKSETGNIQTYCYQDYLKNTDDWPLSNCGQFHIGPTEKKNIRRYVTFFYRGGFKSCDLMYGMATLEKKACVKTKRIFYTLTMEPDLTQVTWLDKYLVKDIIAVDDNSNAADPFYREPAILTL
tara:strand:- start:10564 stop:11025 length:462 start_codon:yes stop_codon:yes gene_type:complete